MIQQNRIYSKRVKKSNYINFLRYLEKVVIQLTTHLRSQVKKLISYLAYSYLNNYKITYLVNTSVT